MVTAEHMTGGRVKVREAIVQLRPASGFLSCSKHHNDNFCEHIEEVIKDHLDIGMLGAPDTELNGTKISVPLVPRHKQWADVWVGEFHEGTESYRLWLREPSKPKGDIFLGFLQHGEGRAVIRGMIYDWFRGTVSIPMLQCNSTSHKFKQEVEWKKHTGLESSAADQFAEYWSVWKTKMCLTCNMGLNFDDLVPDGSSKPNW